MDGRSLMFGWLLLGPGVDPDGYWRENLMWLWRGAPTMVFLEVQVVSLVSLKV